MNRLADKRWTLAAIAVGSALYIAACSNAVYELTSPSAFSFHVVVRKCYSIVAFTLVGVLFRRARAENGGAATLTFAVVATAAYSAAIELGQFVAGSREGLAWNAVDTVCGGLGGALASIRIARRR